MKIINLFASTFLACLISSIFLASPLKAQNQATEKTTRIGNLEWDLHEVTVGTVKVYADKTNFVSSGEKELASTFWCLG
jgi:hypothetical protein